MPAQRIQASQNPFNSLITTCNNDSHKIREAYTTHRSARQAQQNAVFLTPTPLLINYDTTLARLIAAPPSQASDIDTRINLVFWARPPARIKQLVQTCQRRLREMLEGLWYVPGENLHVTMLEVVSESTEDLVEGILNGLRGHLEWLTDVNPQVETEEDMGTGIDTDDSGGEDEHTGSLKKRRRRHWAKGISRLDSPTLVFDTTGIALSFVPSTSTNLQSAHSHGGTAHGDSQNQAYTHHHLRRDLHTAVSTTGIPSIKSRYTVPSAHITIARYVDVASTREVLESLEGRRAFVKTVGLINEWLKSEVWEARGGDWVVGEEMGLELRSGRCWYGGGEEVFKGRVSKIG